MQYTVGARATTHMGLDWARPGVARETGCRPDGPTPRRPRNWVSKLRTCNVYTVTFSLLGQRRRTRRRTRSEEHDEDERGGEGACGPFPHTPRRSRRHRRHRVRSARARNTHTHHRPGPSLTFTGRPPPEPFIICIHKLLLLTCRLVAPPVVCVFRPQWRNTKTSGRRSRYSLTRFACAGPQDQEQTPPLRINIVRAAGLPFPEKKKRLKRYWYTHA